MAYTPKPPNPPNPPFREVKYPASQVISPVSRVPLPVVEPIAERKPKQVNAPNVNPLEAFVQELKAKLARHAPIVLGDLDELLKKAGEIALKGERVAPVEELKPYSLPEDPEPGWPEKIKAKDYKDYTKPSWQK